MSEADPRPDPEAGHPKTVLIANERTKLTATYLNGLAISVFAVGGLAPVFSAFCGSAPMSVPAYAVLLSAVVCWFVSGIVHLSARRFLRRLQP